MPAAVDPRAAGNEDHHRRRFDGQFLGPPHIQQLRRVVAVANRGAVQVAPVLPHLQHGRRSAPAPATRWRDRRRARRRAARPRSRRWSGRAPACESPLARRCPADLRDVRRIRHVPVSPDAHRGRSAKRLKVFPDHGQRRRRDAHRQQVVGGPGAQKPTGACSKVGRGVPAVRPNRHWPNVPR